MGFPCPLRVEDLNAIARTSVLKIAKHNRKSTYDFADYRSADRLLRLLGILASVPVLSEASFSPRLFSTAPEFADR